MSDNPEARAYGQKILIVDDRRENLIALRKVLEDLDAELVEADNGNDALVATLEHRFALAILDVLMPGMSGYELAELLRGDPKTALVPLIFVTASHADERQVFRGYEAGGVDYIVKPYDPQVLLNKVRVFLELDRAREELRRHRDDLETLVEVRTAELNARTRELHRLNAELEQRVAERTAELEHSNRELDDFAYIASHDLKEPLRGIHNYASFLLEDYGEQLPQEGRDKLLTLGRLSRRMENLINALLHYSRLGRSELTNGEVDMNEVLAEVTDTLQLESRAESVEIRCPQPLPGVWGDRTRIAELLQNLIGNAIKYNDSAEKRVEITWLDGSGGAGRVPPPGHEVFRVADNGIGIREKHLDSVFRIFKRLHGRDKYGGGTGAGLTIVRKVVERHGGEVWVESEYRQGSRFYFTLPGLADAVASTAGGNEESTEGQTP